VVVVLPASGARVQRDDQAMRAVGKQHVDGVE
jgi:hypothetical protein